MLRYLEICDGNMEEGSMRCDANVSVRLKGGKGIGNEGRSEKSQLHPQCPPGSIEVPEGERLIRLLEKGEAVRQETRSFDATAGTTFALPDKRRSQ